VEWDRVGACLGELDRSRDAADYQRGLEKLRKQLDPLMSSGDYVDAYAAALALGRHAARADVSTAIREAASEALQSLVLSEPELTRIALERVYSPNSRAAIEALQLLAALGPRLVPRLLAAHERGGPDSRQNTAAVLLVMGDAVFPALVEQLETGTGRRPVLAAELLGEMQNPRALAALSAALGERRPLTLRVAAARAVARIGGERAKVVLESHAQSDSSEVSRTCREALAQWHSPN
jgi:HEAT repeat protein